MSKKLRWLKKISELETIEEKSFWITAPIIAVIGVAGLFTSGFYSSPLPTIVSATMCLIFPVVLMVFITKKKNYHSAYPLLCISVGAISVPLTFVSSGGFLSGMPLFCVIATGITALCYSPKLKYISFGACLLGTTIAFIYVYNFSTPFPLEGTKELYDFEDAITSIYNDVLFGYYFSSLAMFFSINYVTDDIRRYKINQDTLQQFFDIEKRKEILKKSLNSDLSAKTEHRKATILFADISNFTPITEKMSSDLISEFLNEFFSTAGKYIHENGGIIDKYIGDCVMAYWFDNEKENCVLNAVRSMLNLKLEIFSKSEQIYERFGTELNFSVGIAYGDIIFGDIGSDTMHDFTVIGDAVNTASRIQDFAVSGEILVSDAAASKIKNLVVLENVETDHFFKGKNRSIDLYRITGLENEKQSRKIVEKDLYGYSLHICGCRGSFPVSGLRFSEYGGETSCYVIKKDDYAVIVDCGTGLKNAVDIISDCKKIDILLTHVHYDHILGFLMSKFPLDATVRVFGRFGVWSTETNTLEDFMEHPYWPVEIVNTEKIDVNIGEENILNSDMKASFYPSDHPDQACVIKIVCKEKKIVFLADCENANLIDPEVSENSEIVFFDGMFDDNDTVDHKGWGHGTWQDGVRFVNSKNIKKLIITHHNPELGDHTLMLKEMQARELAQNVSFAKSGDIYYF